MPKVEQNSMRILGTGRIRASKRNPMHRSSGYTLLEVLAVLTLIGLITLIVYPQFTISPEKSEIIYIGKLIKSDIELVKEESFINKQVLSIYFVSNGYGYMIDETEISRSFLKYQFTFDLPALEETEPETADGNYGVENQPDSGTGSGEQNPGTGGEESGAEDNELEPHQLMFNTKGKCNLYELSWQTVHFSGKLKVSPDGTLEWTYARK